MCYLIRYICFEHLVVTLIYKYSILIPCKEMEECCHVYQKDGEVYNAVLGMTDLSRGTNSYYKLQVLAHDAISR